MSARYEYRVRWRRDGMTGRAQVFQTLPGAQAKVERMLALDEDKRTEELERIFGSMPDLVGEPVIERRTVGDWEPVDV